MAATCRAAGTATAMEGAMSEALIAQVFGLTLSGLFVVVLVLNALAY
jgi:hypothetical protein